MPGDKCPRKLFYEKPGGKTSSGRPRKRWKEDVEGGLKMLGVVRLKKQALNWDQ